MRIFNPDYTNRFRRNINPLVLKNPYNALTLTIWLVCFLLYHAFMTNMSAIGAVAVEKWLMERYPGVPVQMFTAFNVVESGYVLAQMFFWVTILAIAFILIMSLIAYSIDARKK